MFSTGQESGAWISLPSVTAPSLSGTNFVATNIMRDFAAGNVIYEKTKSNFSMHTLGPALWLDKYPVVDLYEHPKTLINKTFILYLHFL